MLDSRRFRSRLSAGALCLVGTLGVISCLGPTQLTLELRTDVPCGSVRGVSITVGPSSDSVEKARPGTTVDACKSDGSIGTIAVTPAGERNSRVAIRAVLGVDVPADQCTPETKYKGCIVVRRELAFVPHNTLVIPIAFYSACRDVACELGTTCKGPTANGTKECVKSDVEISNPKPKVGSDGGGSTPDDGGQIACKGDNDCPAIQTTPANCATPKCGGGQCYYIARDDDGDGDINANCRATDATSPVTLKVGTDCDDGDKFFNGTTATSRPCGGVAPKPSSCNGTQTCNGGVLSGCVGATAPGDFNCDNGRDNDCNGIVDTDELVTVTDARVCAKVYRCSKSAGQPPRAMLYRTASNTFTIDGAAVAGAVGLGFVMVATKPGAPATPNFVAPLSLGANNASIFPVGVASNCCANGACVGSPLCDAATTPSCAFTYWP